jgi:hypothetical protein
MAVGKSQNQIYLQRFGTFGEWFLSVQIKFIIQWSKFIRSFIFFPWFQIIACNRNYKCNITIAPTFTTILNTPMNAACGVHNEWNHIRNRNLKPCLLIFRTIIEMGFYVLNFLASKGWVVHMIAMKRTKDHMWYAKCIDESTKNILILIMKNISHILWANAPIYES